MTDSSHTPPPGNGATTEVHDRHADARGTVRIAPAVLIELIELTVQGVDGFAGLRQNRRKPAANAAPGAKTYDNGKIMVTVQGDIIDASVALAVHRGANISGLSTEIQRRIGFAVGNMLGMTVRTVDIAIEDIIPGPAPA
jgi:uncharacterized alkaline shock family protein YloU